MANKKILVVEDDKFLRKVYESKLPKEGFDVVLAVDGVEGLEKLKTEAPDLMLLDLIMPRKSGFEVLEELKADKKAARIPILVLSNLGQDEDIERTKNLGATEFLIKSNLSIKEIIEKIKQYTK
jgi:CheY-like chemotaxis protein